MQREGGKDDGVDELLKNYYKKIEIPAGVVRTHDKFTLFSLGCCVYLSYIYIPQAAFSVAHSIQMDPFPLSI